MDLDTAEKQRCVGAVSAQVFANSARSKQILSFLLKEHLTGAQTLGTSKLTAECYGDQQLKGTTAEDKLKLDGRVRAQLARMRTELRKYFDDKGRNEQWRVKIAKGTYQLLFEDNLPKDARLFNEYHALLDEHSKGICRKREPRCGECVLREICREGRRT